MRVYYFESDNLSAKENLDVEKYLMRYASDHCCGVLYFWQNENAIIIGKNQNINSEFSREAALKYNCEVVRRCTGGGCVYHDTGNLNYSFILPIDRYDKKKTTEIICRALLVLKVNAYPNSKNDILVEDKKISGNAYYEGKEVGLHHGTILINADLNRMNEVLSVKGGKLDRQGVKSVHSRVMNLNEIKNDINVEMVKNAIKEEFVKTYGNLKILKNMELEVK